MVPRRFVLLGAETRHACASLTATLAAMKQEARGARLKLADLPHVVALGGTEAPAVVRIL